MSPSLRSGTVLSSFETDIYTFVELRDKESKDFWVITTECITGSGGTMAVIEAVYKNVVEVRSRNRTLNDVYSASIIRVDGKNYHGFVLHSTPGDCLDLSR